MAVGVAAVVMLASASGSPACAAAIFHVRDYGAEPNRETDSGEAIRAAIAAAIKSGGTPDAPAEVVLEAGVYRIGEGVAPGGDGLVIEKAAHLIVRGAGKSTKLIVTNPQAGGIVLKECQQVVLRDLAIDYDPLPYCQGTIRAVADDDSSFDLEVSSDFVAPDAEWYLKADRKWGIIIDPAARRIRSGTRETYFTPRWEHVQDRTWRFFLPEEEHLRNLKQMRVGDAYVHLARSFNDAVMARFCDGVRLENLTIYAAPALAVGLVGNRGDVVVHGLQVRFAPDSNRWLTTNADGIHAQQNRSGPIIEDCYMEGMADDGIIVYEPPNLLLEVREPTRWLTSSRCPVLLKDRLQVMDSATGRVRGEVQVVALESEGNRFVVTLDKELEGVVAGADGSSADRLFNLDACGSGYRIRRNHIRGNRRYGCILPAGDGIVEDNVFEDMTGAGIMVSNSTHQAVGPVPWGIVIRRNRFIRGSTCIGYADSPRGGALCVVAARPGQALAEEGAETIHDIRIEENEFQDQAGRALFVSGAKGVSVAGNRIRAAAGTESRRDGAVILIVNSSGVTLQDNTIADPRRSTTAAVEIGPTLAPDGVVVSGLKAQLHPRAQKILDRRTTP